MIEIAAGIGIANGALSLIKEVSGAFEKKKPHEVREALSEIREKVLDLQSALQDAREREAQLREEIAALKQQADTERQLEDEKGLLYALDDDGQRTGEPYCNHCYVKESKLYRLDVHGYGRSHYCNNCKNVSGYDVNQDSSENGTAYDSYMAD